jgi:hypothetical protein
MYVFGLVERLAVKSSGHGGTGDGQAEGFELADPKELEVKTPDAIYALLANGTVLLPPDVFPLPLPKLDARRARSANGSRASASAGAAAASQLAQVLGAIRELNHVLGDTAAEVPDGNGAKPVRKTAKAAKAAKSGTAQHPGRAWTLDAKREKRLSGTTLAALEQLALSPQTTPIPSLVSRLEREAAQLGAAAGAQSSRLTSFIPVGSALVEQSPLAHRPNGRPTRRDTRVPGEGLARQPGIADLMVLREKPLRYELGEVAHVENVLKGEAKERSHRRLARVEETLSLTTERDESTERELESTERFELQKEASQTVSDDSRLEAGVSVSASYGPTVSVGANVGYAANHAKSQAGREAASYAREVTERSVDRVRERVQETRTIRTSTEVEETNKHSVDNAGGSGHVTGVYRWIDRVSSAQVFNYGRRLMLEFVVPEPAALYLHGLAAGESLRVTLARPEPPQVDDLQGGKRPLTPADISVGSYMTWVERYAVEGVKPPPKPYATVGLAWEEPAPGNTHGGANRSYYKASRELKIPEGFTAKQFAGSIWASTWKFECRLAIGDTWQWGTGPGGAGTDDAMPARFAGALAGGDGELPVALYVGEVWGYSIAIQVLCERTEELFAKWQLETYEAIIRAYLELKSRYEDEVEAASASASVAIQGRPPQKNRETERAELKRGAISLMRGQRLDDFDAIDPNPADGLPEIDLPEAKAEGAEIQFFEQAFEWRQMTYGFYPYFWGRRAAWIERLALDDPDAVFSAFLRAGAARVAVPVRPGFESVALHYLATGQIWEGGQVPQVGDELYVSVVSELQEQLGAPDDGTPVGDPWEVRVPTTLVALQADGSLPVFS